jgi:flagellar hook-associated protein 3 FlgL
MRVSTNLIHDRGIGRISEQQSSLLETQQRLATGRRMLTPSDDPVAASRAIETAQSKAINTEHGANQAAARDDLGLVDNTLASVGDLLQNVRTLVVQAGNSTLTDTDRRSIADELRVRFDELLGLANARDGAGRYLFSGYTETVQPFSATAGGAIYNGDEGQRQLQVGATRTLAVTEPGSAIFQRIRTGNGTFATSQTGGNNGSGVISVGSVVNPAALTGDSYRIVFNVAGTTTTYDIVDVTTSTTISAGNAYTSGAAITFAGMQVEITGAPANGDSFAIAPSTNQSVFTTLANAISVLTGATSTAADRARLDQGVATALVNIDQAHERVLAVRTGVGARMREVDALGELQQGLDLHYAQRLSELQDLDYAKAASDLVRQQQSLDAARESFQRVTRLSLFDFL